MISDINNVFSKWQNRYSGTVLVKQADNILLSFSSGYAHKGFKIPNTIDTMFDTASVTKIFTAAAILQLIERGLLRFEDKITDIIDLNGTKIPKEVQIEHLLTHTSGIADDADEESGEDYAALFLEKPNYSIRNCQDFIPQFAYKDPYFTPGTNMRYNNCAFVLLGLAIEKITKMSYREYITEYIFKACGMTKSHFCAMDEVHSNVAEGYILETDDKVEFSKWRKNIYSYPPIGTADSGAYTTVGDLDIFIRSITQNKLISKKYSELLSRSHCNYSRSHRFGSRRTGYGFEFIEDLGGNILCMYKEGINSGVEAMCSFYPQQNVTVNLLSNQNGELFSLHREIQEVIIGW